jgi:hypothetical protein
MSLNKSLGPLTGMGHKGKKLCIYLAELDTW